MSSGRAAMVESAGLQRAYREALALGEELLRVLQQPPTEEGLARVEQLVEARGRAMQEAQSLLAQGAERQFREDLEALLRQQQALEGQMRRWMDALRTALGEAGAARASAAGARRMMGTRPAARWLDERR
ncbi:MAG: hypothetical protein CWE10_05425 [Symbiobacterium thermophilum]|uniref:Uncharacterized protein n=2 Tax=Symbiobacterium thermophilum TaxID=2734 RepID=A0A953I726_SYMTR|nr:hypothetical protein [Symbiobacterium thermophilum]